MRLLICAGGMQAGLAAQTLAFRTLDFRDGLPQSQVQTILEDREGFLWIGTLDGVARLGPSGFQAFGPSQGLQVRTITPGGLFQARDGAIWAASPESGAARIRGSRVDNFGKTRGLASEGTYSLGEDAAGNLYAGTRQGLFRFMGDRFERLALPGAWHDEPIYALAGEPAGGLWLGSRKGRVALWKGGTIQDFPPPHAFAEAPVLQMEVRADGELWTLFPGGLLRMRPPGPWVPVPLEAFKGVPKLQGFHLTRRGDLVIAMGGDGIYLAPAGQPPRVLDFRSGLSRGAILCAYLDSRGTLWTGSDGSGLAALVVPGMRTLARDPRTGAELGLGGVTHFLEPAPGQMYISSNTGLALWQADRGIVARWNMDRGLPSNDVWSLESDGTGGIWIGTTKGLVHLQKGRITPGLKELEASNIGAIKAHGDRMWVGSDLGLFEFRPDGTLVARHVPPREIGATSIYSLLPTGEGVYVGTRLGLYLFREGRFIKEPWMESISTAWIYTLHQDPRGGLWVGTSRGVYGRLGSSPLFRLGQEEGLLHESISWIQMLPSGSLAIGTGKGVSFWKDGTLRHLTRNMGLLSDETNQDAAYLDRSGRLWIGLMGGACILDPGMEPPALATPRPRVLEAIWSSGAAWLPDALVLPSRPGTLTLHFDVGLPCAPQPCRFEGWLEGSDKTWRPLEGAAVNSLQIAQLAGGNYSLRLRASLDGLHWEESNPFPIHVVRSWHQKPWVHALVALGVLGALLLVVQWRTRTLRARTDSLEARVKERTRAIEEHNRSLERLHTQLKRTLESRIQIMNTVAHDLRSPLTSILISLDFLKSIEDPCDALAKRLDVMDREARRLESILASLLNQARSDSLSDSLNLRLCHPTEILLGLTETLRLKAEARDLNTQVSTDPRSAEAWILADMTSLQQVLFNLLENALKFTPPPGIVGVRTRVDQDEWVLEVWDTGRGIEPAKHEAIFQSFHQAEDADSQGGWGLGLAICQSIVEAHEGRIELDSAVGKGSTFRVVLPLVQPQKPGRPSEA